MTQILIDTADLRDVRALQIAATADQWVALSSGVYRIHSTSGSSVHTASSERCSCPDFRNRQAPCKHVRAVRIFLALSEAVRGGA